MKHTTAPPSERYLRIVGRLDGLIVALVLLLAFLLGAFPARNSDVWMHLASAAQLTVLHPGIDPFNFTTEGVYWTNHAWLFDGGLYVATLPGGPAGFGGIVATFLKAIAVVGLAWLMMRIRRPGQGRWAPAAVTALALITLSPGLELRPMLLSLLFLAGTLLILIRESKEPAAADAKGWPLLRSRDPRRLWLLPFLFVIWVNCDAWFWLGPFTVALFLLGETLQERWQPIYTREAAPPDERRTLWRVLVVGLAVCLINPHHFHAFTLPAELQAARFGLLQGDPLFQSYFTGPFSGSYFTPLLGMSVAGLAYYFLLAITVSSFILNWSGWRWWRLAVIVPFALLGMLHMRLIPFFAVAAVPIITLNIQDFIELDMNRWIAQDPRWRRTAIAGRGVTLQSLLVFVVLAWAGWLHGPQAQRGFGFGIPVDPSLQAVAEQLASAEPARVVNLHPALADYLAWHAPHVRSFFDSRLPLMSHALPYYVRLRSPRESFAAEWQPIQQRWDTHWLAQYGGTARTGELFARLVQDGPAWNLQWFDGRAAVFHAGQSTWPPYDPTPLAFGPHAAQAPPAGPHRLPRLNYLEHFFFGGPRRPLDTDLTEAYLLYHYAAGPRQRRLGLVQAADLVASGVNPAPLPAAVWRLALEKDLAQPEPPAALLLSIRAARRALVENPDDSDAPIYLTQAYDELWRTQENGWAGITRQPDLAPAQLLTAIASQKGPLPVSPWVSRTVDQRQLLRQVQMTATLQHQLLNDPDSEPAQVRLYEMFWRMNYWDVALEYLQAAVALKQRRLGGRDSPELQRDEEFLARREREVEMLRRGYQQSLSPVLGAFQPYGLAGETMKRLRQGTELLQAADIDLYLYLLLTTGRLDELQTALRENPALPKLIGPRTHWYAGMLAAARGNYEQARHELQQAIPKPPAAPLAILLQSLTADQLATPLLGQVAMRSWLRDLGTRSAAAIQATTHDAAEVQLLLGLLALEQGDTQDARRWLTSSLQAAPDPVASRYLELLTAKW